MAAQAPQETFPPQPVPLANRHHTPARDATGEDCFLAQSTGKRIPQLKIKVFSQSISGAPNLSAGKEDVATLDSGASSPMCSMEFVKRHKLYVTQLSTDESRRRGVRIGDSNVVYPTATSQVWIGSSASAQRAWHRVLSD